MQQMKHTYTKREIIDELMNQWKRKRMNGRMKESKRDNGW
jgi:hypothetical protein